jgi:hypothetical protein
MTIERTPRDVYQLHLRPQNLTKWASGLGARVKVRFVERNKYGVLDHFVSGRSARRSTCRCACSQRRRQRGAAHRLSPARA